ncbi:hypothetical protein ACWCOW_38495 [Streptomyces sp. NPDC001939]
MSTPVFFHLRMPQGGELPDLMAIIERFTPVAQAAPSNRTSIPGNSTSSIEEAPMIENCPK